MQELTVFMIDPDGKTLGDIRAQIKSGFSGPTIYTFNNSSDLVANLDAHPELSLIICDYDYSKSKKWSCIANYRELKIMGRINCPMIIVSHLSSNLDPIYTPIERGVSVYHKPLELDTITHEIEKYRLNSVENQ